MIKLSRNIISKFRSLTLRSDGSLNDFPDPQDPIARVALNMQPIEQPWGGGNQWLVQITRHLRKMGYSVRFDLQRPVDCILLVAARPSSRASFGVDDIGQYKKAHSNTTVLHRVNENDLRKGTDFMDASLQDANRTADYTIFISSWLRDYHASRWFDQSKPHEVILNGADPRIFHPTGNRPWQPGTVMRVVTHHWSDNPMKGFEEYQMVDRMIAAGELPGIQLVVIGRWPSSVRWKSAECHPPRYGSALADLLRSCHVYITASRWEPGGMHFIEGLQCGLPLLYHSDGGAIPELGREFGIGFRNNLTEAFSEMMSKYAALRQRVLANAPSGERMCEAYVTAIRKCLAAQRIP